MNKLYERSIEIILENQSVSGAYKASPTFSQYGHSWLRDGSFVAYAMNRAGRHDSARRFLLWVDGVIRRYAYKVDAVLAKDPSDLRENEYLHTRYTLDGLEAEGEWWNFQLDGYGSWLWALAEHHRLSGDAELLQAVLPSVQLTTKYLEHLWQLPNYDCWEEHLDKVHTSTLAALYGGVAALLGLPAASTAALDNLRPGLLTLHVSIREFIMETCVRDGRLIKYLGTEAVDASLVSAVIPYSVLQPHDPIAANTLEKIERDLVHGYGTHRYALDTYYGGGEWTLLSAWLGWYFAEAGDLDRAEAYLRWVEEQADADGNLPEQVSTHLLYPGQYAEWEERWGAVASPLLWSHAMYIILYTTLYSGREVTINAANGST